MRQEDCVTNSSEERCEEQEWLTQLKDTFLGKISSEPIVVLNSVLNARPMVISVIGNILMLVAVLRTSSIHSPSKFVLCSLTLSDLLVGVIVQPLYLAAFFERNHHVLNASRTMSFSLFTMTATAVDRFLALTIKCYTQR